MELGTALCFQASPPTPKPLHLTPLHAVDVSWRTATVLRGKSLWEAVDGGELLKTVVEVCICEDIVVEEEMEEDKGVEENRRIARRDLSASSSSSLSLSQAVEVGGIGGETQTNPPF